MLTYRAPGQLFKQTLAMIAVPIGTIISYGGISIPPGYRECNGHAILRSTYPSFDQAMYCGDSANPTAAYGYHCTNATNPTGARDITGDYIALPNLINIPYPGTTNLIFIGNL